MCEDNVIYETSSDEEMKAQAQYLADRHRDELDMVFNYILNEFYICQQVHHDICNRIDTLPPVIAKQIKGKKPSHEGANGFTYILSNPLEDFHEQIDSIMLSNLNGEKELYSVSILSGRGIDEKNVFVNWWKAESQKNDILQKCSTIIESTINRVSKLEKVRTLLKRAEWHMRDLPSVVQLYRDFASIEGGDVTACFIRAGKMASYEYATSVQCFVNSLGKLNNVVISDIKEVFNISNGHDFNEEDSCCFTARIKREN